MAGRDLEAGGTWLGVSEQGRMAVVTNLRGFGAPLTGRASRGALVTDLLAGEGAYADPYGSDILAFNPFNLILANKDQALFLTNRPEPTRTALAPGIYGLSNGGLDEPWPKTLQLKAALLDWIIKERDAPETLLDILASETLPDFGLPPRQPSDDPREPSLSPIFIRNPVYGTRCSTVIAIDSGGAGRIIERRFTPAGVSAGTTDLTFRWPD